MEVSDVEETLTLINQCHVFKIPPRQSAEGYKAEGWINYHIWSGRCRVVAIGLNCEVRLEDSSTNKTFAVCHVNTKKTGPKAIEPVLDSSRYFVLRIEDKVNKKHAFIGIGFGERSDAFEFNVALQNHQKFIENVKNSKKQKKKPEKFIDYSLKEEITVNFKVSTKGKVKDSKSSKNINWRKENTFDNNNNNNNNNNININKNNNNDDFGSFLPPPPKSNFNRRKKKNLGPSNQQQQQQQQQQQGGLLF